MNTIYYFTGTGNSLYIAKAVNKNEKGTMIRITSSILNKKVGLKGKVGIIYPIYAWGAPAMVEQFIKHNDFSQVSYLYIVATYAGKVRNGLISTQSLIKKRGGVVDAAFSVKMGNNYIIASTTASDALTLRMMEKREGQLKEILTSIKKKSAIRPAKSYLPHNLLASFLIHPLLKFYCKKVASQFTLTDACNGCKICAQVCPANNIIVKEKPSWGTKCETCLACINLCPQTAILYKNSHAERIRYRFPKIKLKELLIRK